MPPRKCKGCSKTFPYRQSLHRHRKRCKGGGADIDTKYVGKIKENVTDIDTPKSKYVWKSKENVKNHCFLLPRDVRMLVIGKSGFGKTTFVTSLLLEPEMMDYNTLHICGRSLHQPEYQIMRHSFSNNLSKGQTRTIFDNQDLLSELYENPEDYINSYNNGMGGIDANFYEDTAEILDPSRYDKSLKHLIVFDDIMIGPQNKVEAFFTRARHNNTDVIYIAQSYFYLPRRTVRENANVLVFFRQDNKNLSHIYTDHCSIDGISFEDFKNFCADVWNESKHNFITIDLSRPWYCGKYRKNLNDYWIPQNNVSTYQQY